MNNLDNIVYRLDALRDSLAGHDRVEKDAGVTSTAGFKTQMSTPSSEVVLTSRKKKKAAERMEYLVDKTLDAIERGLKSGSEKTPDVRSEGIIYTVNGKKIDITNLTNKEKNEYLLGDTEVTYKPKWKKSLEKMDMLIEYLEAFDAPELSEAGDGSLEKCEYNKSFLIKGKIGAWRRVAGRPCFICKDGVIHAGPKPFVGKKAASLRDELRAERNKK